MLCLVTWLGSLSSLWVKELKQTVERKRGKSKIKDLLKESLELRLHKRVCASRGQAHWFAKLSFQN